MGIVQSLSRSGWNRYRIVDPDAAAAGARLATYWCGEIRHSHSG